MGTRIGPTGRQPAAVYWRRRIIVFGSAVLAVWALIAWLMPDPPEPQVVSKGSPARPVPTATPGASSKAERPLPDRGSAGGTPRTSSPVVVPGHADSGSTGSAGSKGSGGAAGGRVERSGSTPGPTASPKPTSPPTPTPPACADDALAVRATPKRNELPAGFPVPIRIAVSNTGKAPCQLTVGPTRLRVVVMHGTDRVWDSASCPGTIPSYDGALAAGRSRVVSLTWNGHRSSTGCPSGTPSAGPGAYSVQVAVGGAISDPATFHLR